MLYWLKPPAHILDRKSPGPENRLSLNVHYVRSYVANKDFVNIKFKKSVKLNLSVMES